MAVNDQVDLGLQGFRSATEIGRGGFGVVYKAWQADLHRWVAIKILQHEAHDEETRRRFQSELQTMARLSAHPYIVTVHGTGFDAKGRPCLVMEWMAKGALSRPGQAPPRLPWQLVLDIGIKLAGALETIHRAGIIHGDVKPENILVSAFDDPALGDFGASFMQGLRTAERQDVHLTIAHAPPEVLNGEPATQSVDTYALASTLHTLLRGMPPFHVSFADAPAAVMGRIATAPPPDLRPLGVPEKFCEVLEKGLAKSPSGRQPSVHDFGEELRSVQALSGLAQTRMVIPDWPLDQPPGPPATTVVVSPGTADRETVALPPDGPGLPDRRRPWIVWVIAAALLLLAIGGGGALLLHSRATGDNSTVSTSSALGASTSTSSPSLSASPTPLPTPSVTAAAPTSPPGPSRPLPSSQQLDAVLPDATVASSVPSMSHATADDALTQEGLLGELSNLKLCGGSSVTASLSVKVRRILSESYPPPPAILGVEVGGFAGNDAAQYMNNARSIAAICEAGQPVGSTPGPGSAVTTRPCTFPGDESLCLNVGEGDLILVRNANTILELYYNNAHDGSHTANASNWAQAAAGRLAKAVATA